MWKRLVLLGIGFLTLLAVLVLISIGLAKRQSGDAPVSAPGNTIASDWVSSMVKKSFPYKMGSYFGVQLAKNPDEVWIIGKRTGSNLYPNNTYVGIVNDTGQYFVKIGPDTEYSTQVGDNFLGSGSGPIGAGAILLGDNVAVRATFSFNFPQAVEVRKLVREPQTDVSIDSL